MFTSTMPWSMWPGTGAGAGIRRQREIERQQLEEQRQRDWLDQMYPRAPQMTAAVEEQLWDDHVRNRVDRRFDRNQSQAYALADIPYGNNALANDVSAENVFTLENVDPERAVYLQTNLAGGRVKQLYDFGGLEKVLQQPVRQSPITRKEFGLSDVRRVRADAVRNVLARMA